MHAQQAPLLKHHGLTLNVSNAKPEPMKLIEAHVNLVQRGLFLTQKPQESMHVKHAQKELLLKKTDPPNAGNAKPDTMKKTVKIAGIVQRGPPLHLDPQVEIPAMHVQQDLLLIRQDLPNVVNAKQDTMKKTVSIVIIVQRVPFLHRDPRVEIHAMHVQQDLLLIRLDPLNAVNVKQEPTKSIEPLA